MDADTSAELLEETIYDDEEVFPEEGTPQFLS